MHTCYEGEMKPLVTALSIFLTSRQHHSDPKTKINHEVRSPGVVQFLLIFSYLPALFFSFLSTDISSARLGWKVAGMAALSVVLGGVRLGDAFGMRVDARGSD